MFKRATARGLAVAISGCALLWLYSTVVVAQGTGKITGTVIDAKSKKPLAYANVVIVGTSLGAMSLDDGKFTIAGVPAGTYTVKAMMMGFKTIEKPYVTVNAAGTAEVSFALVETIVAKTQVIEVLGEKPMVEVTRSDVRASVSEQQIKEMPVDDVIEAVALKTGIVKTGDDLHVRGGRGGEVQFQIDGVPVDDPLGGAAITVGLMGVAGSEIVSGGMDAEYGNAQSAIINITTKEGGPVFAGEIRYMTDDFGRSDKTYTNYDKLSLGFGGPTMWKSLRFYISTEATFSDDQGQRAPHPLPACLITERSWPHQATKARRSGTASGRTLTRLVSGIGRRWKPSDSPRSPGRCLCSSGS